MVTQGDLLAQIPQQNTEEENIWVWFAQNTWTHLFIQLNLQQHIEMQVGALMLMKMYE